MSQTLIKWRLREIMARYNVKATDLAKEMGISANSVSNLRKGNTMPRLDGDSLNKLCNALNKLALDLDEEITPVTLIDYTRDWQPDDDLKLLGKAASLKTSKNPKSVSSPTINPSLSGLAVIQAVKSA
ncbi:MAG: helix-turn-helix domain-containing protein [Microcystaceae cyanobacterium]